MGSIWHACSSGWWTFASGFRTWQFLSPSLLSLQPAFLPISPRLLDHHRHHLFLPVPPDTPVNSGKGSDNEMESVDSEHKVDTSCLRSPGSRSLLTLPPLVAHSPSQLSPGYLQGGLRPPGLGPCSWPSFLFRLQSRVPGPSEAHRLAIHKVAPLPLTATPPATWELSCPRVEVECHIQDTTPWSLLVCSK